MKAIILFIVGPGGDTVIQCSQELSAEFVVAKKSYSPESERIATISLKYPSGMSGDETEGVFTLEEAKAVLNVQTSEAWHKLNEFNAAKMLTGLEHHLSRASESLQTVRDYVRAKLSTCQQIPYQVNGGESDDIEVDPERHYWRHPDDIWHPISTAPLEILKTIIDHGFPTQR